MRNITCLLIPSYDCVADSVRFFNQDTVFYTVDTRQSHDMCFNQVVSLSDCRPVLFMINEREKFTVHSADSGTFLKRVTLQTIFISSCFPVANEKQRLSVALITRPFL